MTPSSDLQNIMSDAVLRSICEGVDGLPPAPRVYTQLTQAASQPRVSAGDLARIVETDPSVSAAVLQLVNSAFFGRMRRVVSVSMAVTYLGVELLKALVLSAHLARATLGELPRGLSLESFQARSLLLARIAHKLDARRELAETAFTTALLLRVGQLILAQQRTRVYQRVLEEARTRALHEVERDHLGVTHCDAGAYLLSAWGLPLPIVEAVAFHHRPELPYGIISLRALLHAADTLLEISEGRAAPEALHLPLLETAQVVDALPRWRAVVAAETGGER